MQVLAAMDMEHYSKFDCTCASLSPLDAFANSVWRGLSFASRLRGEVALGGNGLLRVPVLPILVASSRTMTSSCYLRQQITGSSFFHILLHDNHCQ